MSQHMRTENHKLTRHCEVTAILVLFGLPRYHHLHLAFYFGKHVVGFCIRVIDLVCLLFRVLIGFHF